ncbi:MAG: M24 family metallopeptidase [Oscillospiraceae bacterium]|nr:M24 family metallopeptidase [Oscillospiraceae bacterium]
MKELHFAVEEYKSRLAKTKTAMQEKGVDVLLIEDPANMNWLTGFDGWSFYVHQGLVVALDLDEPIWWGRGQDSNAARLTSWLSEENIRPYDDTYVQNPVKHPYSFVADIVREKNLQTKRIGTEMDHYYYTAKCQEVIERELPDAKFLDATVLVNWVKIVKSDNEIEYMKRAAKIAERVMEVAYDAVAVGVRQCDAAAKVAHAQYAGTPEFGGDYSSIIPLMPAGERTSTPHLSWTDQPYKDGETIILELSGNYRRYHCPLARTMILGKVEQRILDLADTVVEGLTTALEAIRPGMTCEDIERTWAKSIAKSGFIKDSRCGYPIGLGYPPDWGEHTASLRPGDKTVLVPGMCFHLMPGIWLDDCGVEISEPFYMTDKGAVCFSTYPRKLLSK